MPWRRKPGGRCFTSEKNSGETLSELVEFPFRLRNKNKGGKKGLGKLVDVKFCESFFFCGLLKNIPAFLNL